MTASQAYQEIYNNKDRESQMTFIHMYKFYRHIYGIEAKNEVYESKYKSICTEFFKLLFEELLKPNHSIKLPFNTGSLHIVKRRCRIVNTESGKSIILYPVDWGETKKLWSEDEDAANKKILIRYTNEHSGGYLYRFKYKKPERRDAGCRVMCFEVSKRSKVKFGKYLNDVNGYLNCDIYERKY